MIKTLNQLKRVIYSYITFFFVCLASLPKFAFYQFTEMAYLVWRLFVPSKQGSHPISLFFTRMFESKKAYNSVGVHIIALVIIGLVMQFSVTITQGYQGQPEDEAVTTEEFSLGTDPVVETRPTFQDPVNGYISQSFHWYHPGVDIAGNMNQKIRPIMNGRVVMIERSGYGYGNNVVIEHSDGFYSRYAHMAVIQVELNQEVNHESVLGVVGSTGRSTGYHLHLEVYKDNKAVNPLAYIPDTYSRTFVDVSTQETESIGKVVVASSNATNEEVRTLGMTKEMSTSFVSKEVADNYEEMDPYSQAQ